MAILAEDLSRYLDDKRALVESYLHAALERIESPTGCAGDIESCPPALLEAMRYSLLAPGKRLRPLLVILAAEVASRATSGCQPAETALPAACAVEMIHAYSLIHDDLPAMDDDDLRRGMPTCHKRFGEALAILAGDALLTQAFQVLAESYPPKTAAACCRELARSAGAAGMVGGQVEDLACARQTAANGELVPGSESAQGHSLEALESIHARKTGALFGACLRLGVWSVQGERPAGPEPAILAALDEYGVCFGQAFQITDDLLDVQGNADQIGKRVQKDAGRGKLTYPGLLGVAESRRRAESLCQEARDVLQPFGHNGERLSALTYMVLERKR
jgi:geranylgeranyl diphosphate synthase type II